MNYSNYSSISNFGSNVNVPNNNPLTYCMEDSVDMRFAHSGSNIDIYGPNSKPCQLFMSSYCSDSWDEFCEIASKNTSVSFPDQMQGCDSGSLIACQGLTAGEALIHNTASRKYLLNMHGAHKKFEPFDPMVANSPMISYWVPDDCSYSNYGVPEYAVDPASIDNDPVMNKILNKPIIAMNILINIYNTMKRYGTLSKLKGTQLGQYYSLHPYFKSKGGLSG
jgi:hypothetical protein